MSKSFGVNFLVAVLLLAGIALFLQRGVLRTFDPAINMDARLVAMGAHVWLRGENPYDPQAVAKTWADLGEPAQRNPGARGRAAMVYPLGTYALTSGIGALPVNFWRPVWNTLNVILFLVTIWLVMSVSDIAPRSRAGVAFVGSALLMAPSHTNIALGQTGVLVCFAIVLAQWQWLRGNARSAGLASGIALIVKPQSAAAFFVYDLLSRRTWMVIMAILSFGTLMAIGLGAMMIRGINPIPDWLLNIADLAKVAANPFAAETPPYQLINVGALLHRFIGPDAQLFASVFGLLICLVIAFLYVLASRRARTSATDKQVILCDLSITAVLSLILTYHRIYDAVVLLLPLALVFVQRAAGDRRWWITLALLLPFFFPIASYVNILQVQYAIMPQALYENRWFVLLLMHQNWFLLLLSGWLIMLRRRPAGSVEFHSPNEVDGSSPAPSRRSVFMATYTGTPATNKPTPQ